MRLNVRPGIHWINFSLSSVWGQKCSSGEEGNTAGFKGEIMSAAKSHDSTVDILTQQVSSLKKTYLHTFTSLGKILTEMEII